MVARILGVTRLQADTYSICDTKTGWGWKEAWMELEGRNSTNIAEDWTYWFTVCYIKLSSMQMGNVNNDDGVWRT